MGHECKDKELNVNVSDVLKVLGIDPLNFSQNTALKSVLRSPLSLIQGPLGTGMTVVSTAIVYHLRKMTYNRVLVCAPSNIAADQLAQRLHKTGLHVVRLISRSIEAFGSDHVKILTLTELVKKYPKVSKEFLMLQKKKKQPLMN